MTQDIIENTGRFVKNLVLPSSNVATAAQQKERGHALIRNLGTGGAMLGGGTAAIVAALNHLSALRKEREMEDDARLDDDTLYISAPRKKQAGVHPGLAPGLAVTGGILGAGAGYAVVQSIFNAAEKRRRQALLDDAQREALDAADLEVAKSAAAAPEPRVNLSDLLTATPIALPLLTMLATGGLTYATLNKSFPVTGPPKRTGPRRIRVGPDGRPYQAPEEDAPIEGVEKVAALRHRDDLNDAGSEFLASFVAASRPDTVIGSMIKKAALGGLEEMEQLLKTAGVDALLVSLKGMQDRKVPQEARMLATMALYKSAALKATASAIAAAEYLEIHGDTFETTASDASAMSKYATLGCLMGLISRDSALPDLAKQAAALGGGELDSQSLMALLQQYLGRNGGAPAGPAGPRALGDHHQNEARDAALTSDAGGGIGGVSEGGNDSPGSGVESTGDDDVIDSVMASQTPGDVLTPTD